MLNTLKITISLHYLCFRLGLGLGLGFAFVRIRVSIRVRVRIRVRLRLKNIEKIYLKIYLFILKRFNFKYVLIYIKKI